MHSRALLGLFTCASLSLACASPASPRVVPPASPESLALFERVKALEGTWTMPDEQGGTQVASVFTLSSSGSAVREVMFPGTPHEMTNVYHLDGPALVMTHYCAGGNQPRMRAEAVDAATLAFRLDAISNLTAADGAYMGELTLVSEGPDTLRAAWKTFQNGAVVTDHSPVFTLTRRR
jgi:hypothetical protein